MDTRLSEETTTLVESYTVSEPPLLGANPKNPVFLSLMTIFVLPFTSLAARRPNDQSWI